MLDLDSVLLILHVEFDVTERPWRRQAKNSLREFTVLHLGFLSPMIPPLPTQNPDGQKNSQAEIELMISATTRERSIEIKGVVLGTNE